MRTKSKPNTGKRGISTANAYRASVKSATTDLEALIDAYGVVAVIKLAQQLHIDIVEHGDSKDNGRYNIWLNSLPIPEIRKQHKPRASRAKLSKAA